MKNCSGGRGGGGPREVPGIQNSDRKKRGGHIIGNKGGVNAGTDHQYTKGRSIKKNVMNEAKQMHKRG